MYIEDIMQFTTNGSKGGGGGHELGKLAKAQLEAILQ